MVDNTPFFIIGAGRSGTTLLRLILAGHSRLHIPPETWFIRPLVQALPLTEPLDLAQVEHAVSIMTSDYRWPDLAIAADDLRRWALALQQPRLVEIINLVYQKHLADSGKQRFGDKTPIYYEIVPQLLTLYPTAKFIHLIRDGRDVAISWIDVGWERYYERDKFEWIHAIENRRVHLNAAYADRILTVKYEDLVSDLEATVRRICVFLNEDFEPAMLNWRHLTELIPARERHIHGKLNQPVSNDAIAVWRKKLTMSECFAMEACLHRELRQLGYELKFSGAAWRPMLDAAGWLLFTAAPVLGRGTRFLKRRNLLRKTAYI
jgi:Sulfotransferase family